MNRPAPSPKNTPDNDRPLPLRRLLVVGLLPALATACTTTGSMQIAEQTEPTSPQLAYYSELYSEIDDNGTIIPAVDVAKFDRKYLRQVVDYPTNERVGTIIVDPYNRFLYLVMEGGKAMRYGVGVAKAGLEYEGDATIGRKARWPYWRPTPAMIAREPDRYGKLADGMKGGLTNPLGSRALYLYRNGEDTLYRLHGTNEQWSIGKSVSSGCIRMLNQDIMDLYNRVPTGSRVVVLGPNDARPAV